MLRGVNDAGMFKFPEALVRRLRTARRVVVLTGAGVSAESGVPTFRDAQSGLWERFKPEDLATPEAFRRNPRLVWEWYAARRARVNEVQPNPAHFALARMEAHIPDFLVVTQNVDGLHQRAGSRNVAELHGNITRTKCFEENVVIESWPETGDVPPRCPRCGGLLRPDVVWFNEMLPENELGRAIQGSRRCELFFSIGTSAMVYPAASLPYEALEHGAMVVEINPERTALTREAACFIQGLAGRIVPQLVEAIWPPPRSGG